MTRHLRRVSHDGHLELRYRPYEPNARPQPSDTEEALLSRPSGLPDQCGIETVEIRPHHIGYLKLNAFADPSICGSTMRTALRRLLPASALLFDLRDNGGGHPEMVALVCSSLFPRRTHLNDLYFRANQETQAFWTQPPGPGDRLTDNDEGRCADPGTRLRSDPRIVVEVAATEPHRIVQLQTQPIERPPDLALPHLPEEELLARTRQRIQAMVSADQFAGAVLVVRQDQPIFAQAYGFADRERHVPNTLQTRFRIGSMNKMFTAVAILQLVQAGKLEFDQPVGRYLTDYPNQELASKVTIRQLLNHTGATGDFFGPEFTRYRLELRTHEDYVRLFGPCPVRFELGSRWEYSNYGFLILGAVIDRVSGQNYFDYVRNHVYRPAGMVATGSEPEDQFVPNRSMGYTKEGGSTWHPNTDFLTYRGMSAGGGYTTVGDLLRFANSLQSHRLLDAHETELLTTGHVATPGGGHYAYGFEDRMVNGLRCFGHGGGSPGMNGDLEMCPEAGYVVAVLANIDPPAAQRISNFVVNYLPEPPSVHR